VQIVGRKVLHDLALRHADVTGAVEAWICEAEEAEWTSPRDVKERYPHASILSGNRVIFNVKGNRYRIEVKISYQTKVVLVKRAGTHAEYSRWDI
jgi:mRNA interferase HigB